eukprot:TRINITY_DN1089_c0_g1_i12.p1 TRINITY_DN1089_c0_g1~~TRINITY_DN1089_c0_g1_i12.p1  ORF type:complete len:267 (-),score=74.17 TRINITY_DN1089_c0_g1_i12:64-864(-)
MLRSLVGSEMCIRDRYQRRVRGAPTIGMPAPTIPGSHPRIGMFVLLTLALGTASGTQVAPFPCDQIASPIQVVQAGSDGYAAKTLNVLTGGYADLWTLPFTLPTSPFSKLNAVGINPIDSTAYGMAKSNETGYLVRFGEDAASPGAMRMEYILQAPVFSFAGAPDRHGNFHIISSNRLFTFTGIDQLTGHLSAGAPGLANMSTLEPEYTYSVVGNRPVADIVPLQANLEGGSAQDLSLIHISEPTRLLSISYAVFCLKKKKKKKQR